LPVDLSSTKRDTVTVAVLFMNPTLVTRPVKDIGGMFRQAEKMMMVRKLLRALLSKALSSRA